MPWTLAGMQGEEARFVFIIKQTRQMARLAKKHHQKNKPTLGFGLRQSQPEKTESSPPRALHFSFIRELQDDGPIVLGA